MSLTLNCDRKPTGPPDPNCAWCLGTGVVDSGGFTPWDAPIDVACGCVYREPERVGTASAWLARIALLGGIMFVSWLFWRAV